MEILNKRASLWYNDIYDTLCVLTREGDVIYNGEFIRGLMTLERYKECYVPSDIFIGWIKYEKSWEF